MDSHFNACKDGDSLRLNRFSSTMTEESHGNTDENMAILSIVAKPIRSDNDIGSIDLAMLCVVNAALKQSASVESEEVSISRNVFLATLQMRA